MTNENSNLPGTTAPQAQLTRLRKKLTNLSSQLERLSDKAETSKDDKLKQLIARAKANTITALSLTDAVDTIASQTALDLLVQPNNDVKINVAVTAFEDVQDLTNLKTQATASEPVVLQDEEKTSAADSTDCFQTKHFSCCSPDPEKWFDKDHTEGGKEEGHTDTSAGANTCEEPSYLMLTLPVNISSSTARVDEFLTLGNSLVTAVQAQMGQAREAICHISGEDTCSLF